MDLHVVGIGYRGGSATPDSNSAVGAYRASGIFEEVAGQGALTIHEVDFPAGQESDDRIANLGRLGRAIAEAVAPGVSAGRAVTVVGGDCSSLPGILGGLQDALGPATRVGLIWFDAHGDCNTPRTTLSGMLGGMPVAVSAGLCYPAWREEAHQLAPLPTNRIVMVDVRNLDPDEERLIRATDVSIARVAPGYAGDEPLEEAVARLVAACDYLYLHIDSDVLDASLTPNHRTKEPGGPGVAETLAAVDTVLRTGKVVAFGLVSVNAAGPGSDVSLAAALDLLRGSLTRWRTVRPG